MFSVFVLPKDLWGGDRGFLIIINHHVNVRSYIFQSVFIVEVVINRQLD